MKGINIMKKTIKVALASLLLVSAILFGMTPIASATETDANSGAAAAQANGVQTCLFKNEDKGCTSGVFNTIANAGLFIIGALCVIMLIYGGIRYTISGGDSAQVTAAKNTILYAIVGIVVALLAAAVVNWVLATLATQS